MIGTRRSYSVCYPDFHKKKKLFFSFTFLLVNCQFFNLDYTNWFSTYTTHSAQFFFLNEHFSSFQQAKISYKLIVCHLMCSLLLTILRSMIKFFFFFSSFFFGIQNNKSFYFYFLITLHEVFDIAENFRASDNHEKYGGKKKCPIIIVNDTRNYSCYRQLQWNI